MVFSCAAHQHVTAIRRGQRLAFVPSLYGGEDALRRDANNTRLGVAEAQYVPGYGRLV
jgi:hypothetical protein